ncbi:DUF4136 domain-containing protein [Pontibacter mangrovi]|uniref:DUF4136 domain-containing protein n=1 Tax=Pontibacter mangrovi TaxID=2589816 RepID=A0A501VYJ3_9BACT|nr:DUF4136 domain-containing protein [Pontibacter mangrovi]TPE42813.1 DUF4136 domain-containing protein [Pontibacter mangrovi]
MNLTNVRLNLVLCLLCLLVLSCSPVRVLDTKAEEDFKLSNYRTFGFFDLETSGDTLQQYIGQLDFLKQEIAKQLEQRGLQRTDQNPDLKINLGIVVAEEVQTRQTNILTDPPYYMGQRRYTWKTEEVVVDRYKKGTLSVHLVDNAQNKLVWQGAAEGVIPDDNTSKLQERIVKGVQKLMEQIPQ